MRFKSLGGKSRNYLDTLTGATVSRRQRDKIERAVNYEALAKQNKQKDLAAALARPARGRTKAVTQREIETRLEAAQEAATQAQHKRLTKKADAASKRIKVKQIRPQLLKTGHRAARIPFQTYEQYVELLKQMNAQKLPNGRRLIFSYGLGIVGFDERTERELTATLVTLQSPKVKISAREFQQLTDDFLAEKMYFIFSHYFLHLHFDTDYAEARLAAKNRKNLPKNLRKKK